MPYATDQETAASVEMLKHFKPHPFLSVSEGKGHRIPHGKQRVAQSTDVRGGTVRFESSMKRQIMQEEGPGAQW